MTLKRFWPWAAAGAGLLSAAISLRSSSISCSSSPMRARTGSHILAARRSVGHEAGAVVDRIDGHRPGRDADHRRAAARRPW